MWRKKFRTFFQLVGYLTVGLLAVYGLLMVFNGSSPAWAAVGQAMPNLQASPRVPNVLTYQGMLRQPDGTPLDGEYEMTFKLYDSPIGGEPKHTDVISPVVVREGLFTVLLGDTVPIDPAAFAGPLYIGIQVGSEPEMAPRQRIAPVAYAVQLTDGVYVNESGNVTMSGAVGIQTTPVPTIPLLVGQETGGTKLVVNGIPMARWGFDTDNFRLSFRSDNCGGIPCDAAEPANWSIPLQISNKGELKISNDGKLDIPRSYQVFYLYQGQNTYSTKWLGYWDLCALMSTEVTGVDSSSGDWAQCSITINPPGENEWDNWTDVPWFPQPPGTQAGWNLSADAHKDVDWVKCEAICLNLGNFKDPRNP